MDVEFRQPFHVDDRLDIVCDEGVLYEVTDADIARELAMAANVVWQGCAYGMVDPALKEQWDQHPSANLYGVADVNELVAKFYELGVLDMTGINARFAGLN